jgi:hypothetical protein
VATGSNCSIVASGETTRCGNLMQRIPLSLKCRCQYNFCGSLFANCCDGDSGSDCQTCPGTILGRFEEVTGCVDSDRYRELVPTPVPFAVPTPPPAPLSGPAFYPTRVGVDARPLPPPDNNNSNTKPSAESASGAAEMIWCFCLSFLGLLVAELSPLW